MILFTSNGQCFVCFSMLTDDQGLISNKQRLRYMIFKRIQDDIEEATCNADFLILLILYHFPMLFGDKSNEHSTKVESFGPPMFRDAYYSEAM